MIRKRVLSLVLAFAIFLSAPLSGIAARSRYIQSVMPLHDQNGRNFCTAFSISEKEALWATAGHCITVGRERDYEIRLGGDWTEPLYWRYDERVDIAVLKAAVSAPAFRLDGNAPRVGDVLVIKGYPYGYPVLVTTEGKLAAKGVPIPRRPVSDILDITVAGGNSGSPVLKEGRVVGILWGGFTQSPHSLSIPWETLKREIGSYFER